MARFDLTLKARADIAAIADYTTEHWGTVQARAYLDAWESRLTQLARKPLLGRKRDDVGASLFSFPADSHIVYYQRTSFGIIVLRILNQRQDPHRHID